MVWGTLGTPRAGTTFTKIIRQHFPFTCLLPGVYRVVSYKTHDVWHHRRLTAEADTRIWLSSIKLGIKEIYKKYKVFLFVLKNKGLLFIKKLLFMLICNAFIIVFK